jgi:hypothetical protein
MEKTWRCNRHLSGPIANRRKSPEEGSPIKAWSLPACAELAIGI